jgi:hypothetical protein
MSNIDLTQLNAVGEELFEDKESYLHELAEDEMGIVGGGFPFFFKSIGVGDPFPPVRAFAVAGGNSGNTVNANTVGQNNLI